MKHILSVDLEEWDVLAHRRVSGRLTEPRENVVRQVNLLLDLLGRAGVKATFFTLGMFADAHPELVRAVAARGHEIACHGYGHVLVYRSARADFEADTRRAKALLEDLVGAPVCGYRAAEFSILRDSLWALEVLAELGFTYDSSIFPIHHRRYGIPDFDPRPGRYALSNGLKIVELPLAINPVGTIGAPMAGGGYFRLLPLSFLRRAFHRIESRGFPVITYFHPCEFDSRRLDVFQTLRPAGAREFLAGWRVNVLQNLGRAGLAAKLAALLREFKFATFGEFLDGCDLGEDRTLFPAART